MRGEHRAKQPSLFGEPTPETAPPAAAPRRNPRRVAPAETDAALRELAAKLPANLQLGTSSWSFPGWEGLVYDRKASPTHLARHGLAAYAQHPLLRAVGIDRTYYAPIAAEDFAKYAAVVPDGFRFLVKAASMCTDPHLREERGRTTADNELFLDSSFAGDEVVAPYVEGLGDKGGALLFQFPPLGGKLIGQPERFAERLVRFLSELPRGPRYAVELRDRALFGEPYFAALRESGAHHCYSAHPRMPPVAEQRERIDPRGTLIGRWMLHAGLGYQAAKNRYEPFSRIVDEDRPTRSVFAELCVEQVPAGTVLITANNKAEGSAPETLHRLAGEIVDALGERPTEG
jgi:uncharacterized protein YecE (DUF72 family)